MWHPSWPNEFVDINIQVVIKEINPVVKTKTVGGLFVNLSPLVIIPQRGLDYIIISSRKTKN